MHIKSITATSLLVSAWLVVTPAPSVAGPICWIDHITKAEGGIDIYFIQKASLSIHFMKTSGGTSIEYTASNGVVRDDHGRAQDHLFVRDGGEFYALQRIEDSCLYKVSVSEEVGEVTAQAAMHLPGLDPVSITQIVRTDGTVSETEAVPPR